MSSILKSRSTASSAKETAQKVAVEENSKATFVAPEYTISQLINAIPKHCFERSALRSSLYIVMDGAVLAACVWAHFHVEPLLAQFTLPSAAYHLLRAALYTAISVTMGFYMSGLWIVAHECGHQAFSTSKTINDSVGWVLHSMLLVPYHSWKITHAKHHAGIGHLTRDEVWIPRTRSEMGVPPIKEEGELEGVTLSQLRQEELLEAVGDAPLATLFHLVCRQIFGWPLYLLTNASGHLHTPWGTSHFDPKAVIFKPQHFEQIVVSDLGIFLVIAGLVWWSHVRSFREMAVLYLIPYLQVNHWMVALTYLQHTDPLLPHYEANKWTQARGALATMDRQFLGPVGAYALHGICETHIAHHVSSRIPHYHAWEATAALKEFLGEQYYMKSDENFLVALWSVYRACRWIEDKGEVRFFKNARGLAAIAPAPVEDNASDSGVDLKA